MDDYDAWQAREERLEARSLGGYYSRVIETFDPESVEVLTALASCSRVGCGFGDGELK